MRRRDNSYPRDIWPRYAGQFECPAPFSIAASWSCVSGRAHPPLDQLAHLCASAPPTACQRLGSIRALREKRRQSRSRPAGRMRLLFGHGHGPPFEGCTADLLATSLIIIGAGSRCPLREKSCWRRQISVESRIRLCGDLGPIVAWAIAHSVAAPSGSLLHVVLLSSCRSLGGQHLPVAALSRGWADPPVHRHHPLARA